MAQPEWKEVGNVGDVSWPEYDGGPVFVDQTGVYPPELEYVETPAEEADFEDPKARWTVWRVVLDKGVPDWGELDAVADSTGMDPDDLRAAFESDDPMERASAYVDWAGHYGWIEFDQYPLTLTCAEVNKRYPHAKLNCYGSIQSAIEEEVERLVDENAAQGWSYAGDQLTIDIEDAGFDPESVVVEANFGDAIAVNGDPLVGGWAKALGVKANDLWSEVGTDKLTEWLEANGYEYLSKFGGRVPTTEAFADAETVIDAVERRFKEEKLKVSRETIEEAAEALDWWQEEIPGSSSGGTYVWAKKKAGAEERRSRRR